MKMSSVLAFLLLILPIATYSQSGPGGVSHDANVNKNCRLWLDAGDLASLTQPDGSEVTLWYDKSKSAVLDTAIWVETNFGIMYSEFFTPPLFRSDPAYSINGRPVVSFEDGGMLLMGLQANQNNNLDLVAEASGVTKQRTIFIAFRTGNDISSRQFLWEQGGGWRGLGMYIYNSEFYIGVYDIEGLKFGYSYKRTPIQPNTTYVASLVFDVSNVSGIDTDVDNKSFIGTLNGQEFGLLEMGAGNPNINTFGVGQIKKQGDPIGIGGVNSLVAHESSIYDWDKNNPGCRNHIPCDNSYSEVEQFALTGQFRFKGRIAEIAYYAYSLNAAERIIVENYLAAKYFANTIENDRFQYKSNFGHDVIGIGAELIVGNYEEYNISKGDNLFEISADDMAVAFKTPATESRYLLVGHNNNPIVWTTQNTPDSTNVQRLRRTWRFDRSGTAGDESVKIRFAHPDSSTGLPQLPANYKYAVLIDTTNGPLPNFSTASNLTEIVLNASTGWYEGNFSIPHGAYFTIAAVKPTIQFKNNSAYTLETNDPEPTLASVEVELNYTPVQGSTINTGVIFTPLTANNPDDYTTPNTAIAITPPSRTGSISFNIINDQLVDIPPVKEFLIILDPIATDIGYHIGSKDTLLYKIYDDDPEPKATFQTETSDIPENGTDGNGLAEISVRINGTTESSQDRTVRIIDNFTGTATYGLDYTLPAEDGWSALPPPMTGRYNDIVLPAGTNQTVAVQFTVLTDNLDEENETIHFTLEPKGDIGADGNSIIGHTVNVIDINPEPEVRFLAPNSEGFEAVSQPRIVVSLTGPSAKTIQVPFAITGGTATNGAIESNSDYTAEIFGTVVFPPGDTISYLYYDPNTGNVAFQVYSDEVVEPDETIFFELQEPVINATLGTENHHTYTIKDYVPFEFRGAAGIGQLRDNTFWINLDGATTTATSSSVPQISTRPITIRKGPNGSGPAISLGTNNQKVMKFNGTDQYFEARGSKAGQSPFINTAGFYDSKSVFFVVKPYDLTENPSTPQVIYEEGGEDKGLNIYLKDQRIYFQAWNTTDDDGSGPEGNLAPWGDVGNTSYVMSNELTNNQVYVVSCHYNNTELDETAMYGLRIYVNGELQGTYGNDPNQKVGRLYVHSEKIGIGGINNKTRFGDVVDHSESGKYFKGEIGEMIYYNESGHAMNTARIRIIHNYLSARFNIPLIPSQQIFDLTYADRTNNSIGYITYNNDVAGIGIVEEGNIHGVAQGQAQLKVTATGTSITGTDKFLVWGHNNESFTNTWPFSYNNASLPGAVKERSGRVWRFTENNNTTTSGLSIEMNFSESGNAIDLVHNRSAYLRLLVSPDATDWSTATVFEPSSTQPDVSEGARVIFDNVSIPSGSYVALGNTSHISVSPLPIELLDFTARFEVDHVNLRWITSTEHNNAYFIIERAGENFKWEEIIKVPGAGSSTSQISYFEKDRNPLPGVSYYRLKQVDFDETFTYSDVVSILNTSEDDNDAVFMFPNPATSGTIFLRIPDATKVYDTHVRIFNMHGTIMWSGSFESGSNLLEINYVDLSPSLYLVEVKSDIIYESKKLIVQ